MRRAWLCLPFSFGLLFAISCGDDGGSAETGETGEACSVGAAGCPCTDGGSCDAGLEGYGTGVDVGDNEDPADAGDVPLL